MKKLALIGLLMFGTSLLRAEGGVFGQGNAGAIGWKKIWRSSTTAAVAGNTTVISTGPSIIGYVQILSTGSSSFNFLNLSTSNSQSYVFLSSFTSFQIPTLNITNGDGIFVNWIASNGFALSNITTSNGSSPSGIRILWDKINIYEPYPAGQ